MIDPRRLEDLVLARLAPSTKSPPSPSEIAKGLFPFVSFRLSESEWRRELGGILTRLREIGELESGKLALTSSGQRRLAQTLGMAAVPKTSGWREFKTKYLPRLVDEGRFSQAADRNSALGLIATELDLSDIPLTEAGIGNAWLKRSLGLRGKVVTLDAVRAVLLARALGLPGRPRTKDVLKLYAVKLTGAKSTRREDILQAQARKWLEAPEHAHQANTIDQVVPDEASAKPAETRSTIERILAAARSPNTRRFGDGKAFIASVWQQLSSDPDVRKIGEAGFKQLLVEAHQRGELTLSRADLVSAMDPNDVAASETRHLNATYHFIQISGDRP